MEKNGLVQFVDAPTRVVDSCENILDLFITNSSELFLDVKAEDTMLSDHEWVTVSLASDFTPEKMHSVECRPFSFSWFDFNKADFNRMNAYIENVDWNTIFMEDPENFSKHFEKTLSDICHLCVPLKNSYSEIPSTNK